MTSISRSWTMSATCIQAVDPMPADLPERIRFSLALRGLEVEVARLTAEEDLPVLATRAVEQSRTSPSTVTA